MSDKGARQRPRLATCFRTHENAGAVQAGGTAGTGRDLDDAVLGAVNQSIHTNQSGLVNTFALSFACEDLPNLDTFTRSDGMAVLYRQSGKQWHRIGMTVVIIDNLAPAWIKSFDVQCRENSPETQPRSSMSLGRSSQRP